MTDLFTDAHAQALDAADPLRDYRNAFHLPLHDGAPMAYFVGNSLGLQPLSVRRYIDRELDDWARHGVEGHFRACLLYTSPSPRDRTRSRMPSSA